MRKTMKTAAVVAAMSAMTIASASVAFAATAQKENVSSVAKSEDAAVTAESFGEWNKTDDGWKFAIDGKNLKDTWAEIDGVWYYFNGEIMAQEDFLYLDDKGYYFAEDGRMATGWQKITSDTDAYGEIEISEQLINKYQDAYVGSNYAYDYYDYVWCYFNEDGSAKEDEWFKDDTSYHYYFDGHVMVMNIMDYVINPDNYDLAESDSYELFGFDQDGHMLTGWNYLTRKKNDWNDPTVLDKNQTYYYYDMDGTMQKTGWAKIDNNWYLFANYIPADDDLVFDDHEATNAQLYGYPLITNSYIISDETAGKPEYFYVDKNGKMATSVTKVPKDAFRVEFYNGTNAGDDEVVSLVYENYGLDKIEKDVYVNFGSNGAAAGDKVVNGKYYVKIASWDDVVIATDDSKRVTASVQNYSDCVAVSGSAVTGDAFDAYTTGVEAALVKNGFIGVDADTLYLADEDGNLVKNKAVLYDDNTSISFGGTVYTNAFILFSSSGKAYDGYEGTERSVSIGGVKYWATNQTVTVGNATVTVFVSSKLK